MLSASSASQRWEVESSAAPGWERRRWGRHSPSLASSLVVGGALFRRASLWARVWGVPDVAPGVQVIALTFFHAVQFFL